MNNCFLQLFWELTKRSGTRDSDGKQIKQYQCLAVLDQQRMQKVHKTNEFCVSQGSAVHLSEVVDKETRLSIF